MVDILMLMVFNFTVRVGANDDTSTLDRVPHFSEDLLVSCDVFPTRSIVLHISIAVGSIVFLVAQFVAILIKVLHTVQLFIILFKDFTTSSLPICLSLCLG